MNVCSAKLFRARVFVLSLAILSGCATTAPVPIAVAVPEAPQISPAVADPSLPPPKSFKLKIAIGRFTNETRYGRALLAEGEADPLGRQTSDMLDSRLVETGRFLVFERQDLGLARSEQALIGMHGNIVGVDTLIVGSLTEFGRSTQGENGFLSATKVQTARAKV